MRRLTLTLIAALFLPLLGHAQPGPIVDCRCLAGLHELNIIACQAVVPDLCALAIPCSLSPLPLQCSQTPPAGTPVGPGIYPISVTFVDPFQNITQSCNVKFEVTIPPGGCGGTGGCLPPPPGMVGWWPLDELAGASVYADLSGSGNAGLVQSGGPLGNFGSPSPILLGKVAGASYFYGPTVQGFVPNATSLNFGTGSFSMDAWVNPSPFLGGRQPILDKLSQPTTTSAFGYAVSILNGIVELRLGDGTLYTHNGPPILPNMWNFVAVAVDRVANTVTFHVNGVTSLPQTLVPAGSFNSGVALLIGGSHAVNDPYGELGLDEVELFNRVLTSAEMSALYLADSAGKCKQQPPCTNSVVSIFCPPDTNVETCVTSAVVFYPPPLASTSCGSITNLVCVPPSGSGFPLGTTVVTCTATDSQGNSASCTFKVIVTRDLTPPGCPPASITVTGCPPRVPNFGTNGMIADNCTPANQINVQQSPPAGTVLAPGISFVNVTACDAASNCVTCVVAITAVYTGVPPEIICPSNIVASAYYLCETNGLSVTYLPPQVMNGVLVSCTPPPGSAFPFGTTVVTCVATNACATNTCSFTVTVNFGGLQPNCTPPPSNLVMWLKFDEASGPTALNAYAGNNGVLVNGPVRNFNQYVKNSLCFDGVNDYVQVQPYAAMQFGTGDFSVDAWVKPATLGNTVRVIVDHRQESGPLVRGYSLFLGANNTLGFQIADGTFINYPSTLTVPADGRWHLVAVTVKRNDPQGIRFYVDGVQDSVPRDPTGHPGSVTAGPCYPFRVGSRSSTVSGLFPGCIDEVELFRRALKASEIQAIYDARCIGKCRISCQLTTFQILNCWLGGFTNILIFNNPLPVGQTLNYTIVGLPPGPGCTAPAPVFSPSSGTIYVPPYSPAITPTYVTLPGGLSPGQCACYRMVITTADGSQRAECEGKICLPRAGGVGGGGVDGGVCVSPSTSLGLLTNLEPGTVSFLLQGTTSSPIEVNNARMVLLSPDQVPVASWAVGKVLVPAAGGGVVEVPQDLAFTEYDPGQLYTLTFDADLDGSGVYETLALMRLANVLPLDEPENTLSIRRGIGGTIIIVWPNPCATLEVNPNLGDPSGWVPALQQTSPVVLAPGASPSFLRLRN